MLALAYMRTSHAWPGSRVLVVSNGRPRAATVTATPFFDPEGVRLRAKGPRRV
jgi:glycine cleavage system aminomethyltransferase T